MPAQIDVRYSVESPVGDATINVLGTITLLEAARRLARGGSCSPPPAEGCTATPTCCRRPRTIRSGRSRPTVRASTPRRATASCMPGSRALDRVAPLRQRVRAAAGRPRRGRGGGDLLRAPGRAPAPTVFGDGRQTRDWVDVSRRRPREPPGRRSELTGPVNIAQGRETRVLDLVDALDEVSDRGPMPAPQFAPERLGEVQRSCLDVNRARRDLGWEAEVQLRSAEIGVLRTMSWPGGRMSCGTLWRMPSSPDARLPAVASAFGSARRSGSPSSRCTRSRSGRCTRAGAPDTRRSRR